MDLTALSPVVICQDIVTCEAEMHPELTLLLKDKKTYSIYIFSLLSLF
jgi:hypothetical protein